MGLNSPSSCYSMAALRAASVHHSASKPIGVSSSIAPAGSYVIQFERIDPLIPNLFRETFMRHGVKVDFMHKFLHHYDRATNKVRKPMLESILEFFHIDHPNFIDWKESSDILIKMGHLVLVRMVAHLSVTLPKMSMKTSKLDSEIMLLQLLVIHEFLSAIKDQDFVVSFFDTGCSFLYLKILSPVDFNVSDDLRAVALDTLLLVAKRNRIYKEALCESDILTVLVESLEDTLAWETLPKFSDLLCELFRGNPKFQKQILDTLEHMLTISGKRICAVPQRVLIQALNILIQEAFYNNFLQDELRLHGIIVQLLQFLESGEPRLCIDVVRLLCKIVETFPKSAKHLFKFCKKQILEEEEMESMAFRLEKESSIKACHKTDTWLVKLSSINTSAFGYRATEMAASLEEGKQKKEDKESHLLLRWELVTFVCWRNPTFCENLVQNNMLTQNFLYYMLDMSNPVLQDASLHHLHSLRLFCVKADVKVRDILQDPSLINVLTHVDLITKVKPSTLKKARYNLRNSNTPKGLFPAAEFVLMTQLITDEVALMLQEEEKEESDFGDGLTSGRGFFLTETDGGDTMGSTAARYKNGYPTLDTGSALATVDQSKGENDGGPSSALQQRQTHAKNDLGSSSNVGNAGGGGAVGSRSQPTTNARDRKGRIGERQAANIIANANQGDRLPPDNNDAGQSTTNNDAADGDESPTGHGGPGVGHKTQDEDGCLEGEKGGREGKRGRYSEAGLPRGEEFSTIRRLRPVSKAAIPFYSRYDYTLKLPEVDEFKYGPNSLFLNDPFEDHAEKHQGTNLIREEHHTSLHQDLEQLSREQEEEFESTLRRSQKTNEDISWERTETPMEFQLRVGHVKKVVKELSAEYSQFQEMQKLGSIVEDSTRDDGTFPSLEPGSWSLGAKDSYLAFGIGHTQSQSRLDEWMQYSQFQNSMTEDGMRDLNTLSQVVRTDMFLGQKSAELLLSSKNNPDGPYKRRLLCLFPSQQMDSSATTSFSHSSGCGASRQRHKRGHQETYKGQSVDDILREAPDVGQYNGLRSLSFEEREHTGKRFGLPHLKCTMKPPPWRSKQLKVEPRGGGGAFENTTCGFRKAWDSIGITTISNTQQKKGSNSTRFWRGKNLRLFPTAKLKRLLSS